MPSFTKLVERFREELPEVLSDSHTLSIFFEQSTKDVVFFTADLRPSHIQPGRCLLAKRISAWLTGLENYTQRNARQLVNSEIAWSGSETLSDLLYLTWKMNLDKLNSDLIVVGSETAERIMHRAFLLCTSRWLHSSYQELTKTSEGRFWSSKIPDTVSVHDQPLFELFCELLTDALVLRVQVIPQHPLRGTAVGEICRALYKTAREKYLCSHSTSGATVSPRTLARATTQKVPDIVGKVRFDVPSDDMPVTTSFFSVAEVQELRHQITALYKDPHSLYRIAVGISAIADDLYQVEQQESIDMLADAKLHHLLLTIYRIRKHAEALNRCLIQGSSNKNSTVSKLASMCQKGARDLEVCIKQEFMTRLSSEEELVESSVESSDEDSFLSIDLSD